MSQPRKPQRRLTAEELAARDFRRRGGTGFEAAFETFAALSPALHEPPETPLHLQRRRTAA